MPKTNATYTIDPAIKSQFDLFCEEHHYNKSAVVESLIQQWTKETKNMRANS